MPWPSDVLQHAFTFERAAATPYTLATLLVPPYFSFYVMAVLVQLPRTSLYRVALLPVVLWSSFRAGMSLDVSYNCAGYAYLNLVLASAMFAIAMRSTAWAFVQRPYSRLPICKSGDRVVNDQGRNILIERDVSVSSAMWNACDLLMNTRVIGWNEYEKTYVPMPYFRVESLAMFSLLSFGRFILWALVFDSTCTFIYLLGPDTFGASQGGTIFDPSLTPPQRYLKSSIVTLLSGFGGYAIIESLYQLHAALFTALFHHHPSQWPPLFDSPWLSTSLTSFWGRRWHQLNREYFVAVGGKPMVRYFGRAGLVIGAFAISGLLHDVGVRAMGRGQHTLPVVGFFLMQGVGVVMEGAWKQATGKRVGGLLGWLWAFLWLLLWGNAIVDAWARAGLLGSEFSPTTYKPSTLFLTWMSQKK